MRKRPFLLLLLFPLFALSAGADFLPEKDARITAFPNRISLKGLEVRLRFELPGGIHITHNENLSFRIDPGHGALEKTVLPSSRPWKEDRIFASPFEVKLKISMKEELLSLPVRITFQACDETKGLCFLPVSKTVLVKVPAPEKTSLSLEDRFTEALENSIALAFLLVFLAGILASLTPCVYPVIPLTMGYIGSRSAGSRFKGFILSLFLVAGLSLTYAAFGLLAAGTGSVFGSLTQTPLVTLLVALFFIAMSASMFGLFVIQLPPALSGRLLSARRKGYAGALIVGMITGLVSAPCVGPLLLSLLAWIARSRSFLLGFSLLFVFAWGMGLLFILIGTFAAFLRALPAGGVWTELVKYLFGFLLLAAGYMHLAMITTEKTFVLAIGLGLLLFGILILPRMELLKKRMMSVLRMLLAAAGILAVLLAFFRPSGPGEQQSPGSGFRFINEEEAAFRAARMEKKRVFMDFYADWCAECREMHKRTFPRPEVKKKLEGYVTVLVDLTQRDGQPEALAGKYGVLSLPVIILFSPDGREIKRLPGRHTPASLLRELN